MANNPFADLIPENKQNAPMQTRGADGTVYNFNNPDQKSANPFSDLQQPSSGMIPESLKNIGNDIWPKMQKPGAFMQEGSFVNPETIQNMANVGIGGPGMQLYGESKALAGPLAKLAGKGLSKTTEKLGEEYPALKNYMEKINPRNLMLTVQKGADKLKQQSSDIYNLIRERVAPEGVGKIELSKNLIDEAGSHLSKTRASELLIKNARSGDYNGLHELQSDLWKKAAKLRKEGTYAGDLKADEIMDTRNKINEAIRNKFHEHGKGYLASLLDKASGMTKNMYETYYKHPQIAKLVDKETRMMPKNPVSILSEESERIAPVIKAHPELLENMKSVKNYERLKGYAGLGTKGLLLEEFLRRGF